MRLRSVPVLVLVGLAALAVYVVCQPRGGTVELTAVAVRLSVGGTIVAGYYSASLALRRVMGSERELAVRPAVVVGAKSGPGRFRVNGVDRATRLETTEFVSAESPDGARIKVDLKGVDVTTIERVN